MCAIRGMPSSSSSSRVSQYTIYIFKANIFDFSLPIAHVEIIINWRFTGEDFIFFHRLMLIFPSQAEMCMLDKQVRCTGKGLFLLISSSFYLPYSLFSFFFCIIMKKKYNNYRVNMVIEAF